MAVDYMTVSTSDLIRPSPDIPAMFLVTAGDC